jgi:hypothetical protein
MRLFKIILVILLCGSPLCSQQQNDPVDWTANWIWQQADGPQNTWMFFRKSFELENVPTAAMATIAVDSKYWLTVNGQLVMFEGGLNRGPTPTSGYFDRIDIQPYLLNGKNTIAILVWYWGNDGRNNIDSGKGGLLFQADLSDIVIKSDGSWKIKQHPAYGHVPFQLNAGNRYYLYGGWNIGFDARNDMPGWMLSEYDDSLWFNATEKGVPPCEPWNELVERPIPLWKDSGLLNYSNAQTLPRISDGQLINAKLPYNAQITPYFKVKAQPGLKIKIQTDHYDIGGYYGQRTEYITRAGVQEFESFAWQNGESVIYDIPAGIEILELKYRETGYACDFAGYFACNDEFYNTLFEKAKRTLYVCMRDNYMDCPDRERGQWIGDVATYIPQTFYLLDRSSDLLTLKCVDQFVDWRDGDLLKGLAPGSDLTEYASQSLNAISDIGIMMTYYEHTGDVTAIQKSYSAIKNYLNVWHLNDNGLIEPRATWNGQGRNVDHTLIENTWYYMALTSAKKMAQLTDNWSDVPFYQTRMDSMANNFDRHFWQGDVYRSSDFIDDRANGLVVLSGLAGEEKYAAITDVLQRYTYAGPYMEGYIIQALCRMGEIDAALNRIKIKYGPMVTYPETTTLWEAFWWIGSSNHAWSGAPMTSLFQYIAGVAPKTPGYEIYQVMPHLGALEYVEAVVPSIKGDIQISIKRPDDDHFVLDLESPTATTAIVGIPKDAFQGENVNAIEANGKIVWRRGYFIGDNSDIEWAGEDDRFYKFKVKPGSHNLVALRAPLRIEAFGQASHSIVIKSFPNPFNSKIKITIRLQQAARTRIKIYDMLGNEVKTIFDDYVTPSEHQFYWDGTNNLAQHVASGVYFYHVISGTYNAVEKIVLIR